MELVALDCIWGVSMICGSAHSSEAELQMIHSEELSLMTPKKKMALLMTKTVMLKMSTKILIKLLQYTWELEIFIDILSVIVSFSLYMDLLYRWSYMTLTELPGKHAFWLLAQVKSCKMSAIFNPDSTGLW